MTDLDTSIIDGKSPAEINDMIKQELSGEEPKAPVEIPEATPQTKPEEPTQEVKDKQKQKEKILKSQAHMRKEIAVKEKQEKEALIAKMKSWEIENDLDNQEKLLEKMTAQKVAENNFTKSLGEEKFEFIKQHASEIELLSAFEEIVKDNPTLSLEQARILYYGVNSPEKISDPYEDNRTQLNKQSTPGQSVVSEEKWTDKMTSAEIENWWKQALSAGKIAKTF